MEIRALLSAMWRSRVGPVLVAAQVAITLAVVVNVAYIVQLRIETASQPTGLDLDNIFWVTSQAYAADFNGPASVAADLAWLQSLPGVVAAASSSLVPQGFGTMSLAFATDPAALDKGGGQPAVVYFGSEQLIQTLGVKLVAGRAFDPAAVKPPQADPRAALGNWGAEIVITKNLADKLFPNGDALGKIIHAGLVNKPATVVGIVELMQHQRVMGPAASFFSSIVMVPTTPGGARSTYLVRTQPGRRDAIMARVEKELPDLQPGRYISAMESLANTAERQRRGLATNAVMLGVVAAFVVLVTVVGIVGLAAFTVATRTRQLGTRRAIGATKFHILRYFLVENWLITSMGAFIGCGLALAVGIQLSKMYRIPQLPLVYIVGGVVALWLLGLLAVWLPARRAAAISPAIATRTV
ncbi:MAG: FtsX-like permease family protein [Gammaproteobacteria bacterium]